MEQLLINGKFGTTKIFIDETLENFQKYVDRTPIFITDSNLFKIYNAFFKNHKTIVIPAGEKFKTIETVVEIYKKLIEFSVDRHSYLIGVGGGVVLDLTGFVATTFMRGVDFGFVATSLLAQVDASIGGKNGFNFGGVKNLIGTFNQPKFVLCDVSKLTTLPKEEFFSGFGEILKHALIGKSSTLFDLLKNWKEENFQDFALLKQLLFESLTIKKEIVQKDEFEKNERKKLNFGHTLGHVFEIQNNLKHGFAVVLGMKTALELSLKKGFLSKENFQEMILFLQKFKEYKNIKIETKLKKEILFRDKKSDDSKIDFVYLKRRGESFVFKTEKKELLFEVEKNLKNNIFFEEQK